MRFRSHSSPQRRNILSELLVITLLVPLILTLATFHLDRYPLISGWDEGIYLQFATNLAQHGEYATRDGAIFNRMTPVGGTGITLIAPVALVLKWWPSSLIAARLVVTCTLALLLAITYLLVRAIAGWRAACAAIPLLLVAGHTTYDTLWVGRQVLAEIPALAMLLGGVLVWMLSWRRGAAWIAGYSLLFTIAVITKNQFIWIVVPVFGFLALADRCYYHQLDWRTRLVPIIATIAGAGIWTIGSFWIIGAQDWPRYLEAQRLLSVATYLHVDLHRWAANARLLWMSGQLLPMMVGIGYVTYRSRTRTIGGLQHLMLLALVGVALAFFGLLNLPWARYLYPPLALAALCTALLLDALAQHINARQHWLPRSAVLAVLVIVLAGPRIARDVGLIVNATETDTPHFAALVDRTLPEGVPALNWEWEVEFYSHRTFMHPPGQLFAALVDETYNQRLSPLLDQPRISPNTQYIIIGPFATQTHVFDAELATRPHQLVAEQGPYRLYRLQPQ